MVIKIIRMQYYYFSMIFGSTKQKLTPKKIPDYKQTKTETVKYKKNGILTSFEIPYIR